MLRLAPTRHFEMVSYSEIPKPDFKIAVLGASGVGKTSLVKSFFREQFAEQHIPTVDDYFGHTVSMDGNRMSLCIVDTSGTYSFPAMRRLAINFCDAYIVVYSVDDPSSFTEAVEILDEVYRLKKSQQGERTIPVCFVANKLDISDEERRITGRQGQDEINSWTGLKGEYLEISARLGFRTERVFFGLLKQMMTTKEKRQLAKRTKYRLQKKMKYVPGYLKKVKNLWSSNGQTTDVKYQKHDAITSHLRASSKNGGTP